MSEQRSLICDRFGLRERLRAPHRPGALVVLHRVGGLHLGRVEVGDLAAGAGERIACICMPRAHLEVDAAAHRARQVLADHHRAVAAHQRGGLLAEGLRQRLSQLGRLDQQVRCPSSRRGSRSSAGRRR